MLLAQGLQQQGQAYRQGLEKELAHRDDKIRALEQELETAKKQAEEAETARKISEVQVEKMREDFDCYHRQKNDERKKIVADAKRWPISTRS